MKAGATYHELMREHSRLVILQALREAHGNRSIAAERLGLQRTYLLRLMREHGHLGAEVPPNEKTRRPSKCSDCGERGHNVLTHRRAAYRHRAGSVIALLAAEGGPR